MRRLLIVAAMLAACSFAAPAARAQNFTCGTALSSNTVPSRKQLFISAISGNGATATVTSTVNFSAGAGTDFASNDFVTILNVVTQTGFNVAHVQITVTGANTFTFASAVNASDSTGQVVWSPVLNAGDGYTDPVTSCPVKLLAASTSPGTDYGHNYIQSAGNSADPPTRFAVINISAGKVEIRDAGGNVTNTWATLNANAPGIASAILWSRSNPNIFYFHTLAGSTQLKTYDVSNDTVANLGLALTTANGRPINCTVIDWGGNEGSLSPDGDVLPVNCNSKSPPSGHVGAYKISTDTLYVTPLSAFAAYDNHKILGSNKVVIVSPTSGIGQYKGVGVWSADLSAYLGQARTADLHLGAGFAADGVTDGIVIFGGAGDPAACYNNGNQTGVVLKTITYSPFAIVTTCIDSWQTNQYIGDAHISMEASGKYPYVLISTNGPQSCCGGSGNQVGQANFPDTLPTGWAANYRYPTQQVRLVALNGSGGKTVAHVYSRDNASSTFYYAQTRCGWNYNGNSAVCDFNFGLNKSDVNYTQPVLITFATTPPPSTAILAP